ncbi:Retrotransposon gag domain [Arabidopsis suecica]|uniref:Retrotransposon gag domain n=1 Tax=Arabidopsis suecica TaxID=45249 RepID=A0A8T1XBC2_ARASU|nr:Retrotransposon gag domain [Arabidopsis suecica]
MELVADYDLDIAYHPRKANQVADALSRRRCEVEEEKNQEAFIKMMGTLHLNALSKEFEPLGLGAVDQADLLCRIRLAQKKDNGLNKWTENNKTEYQTSNNGTIMVNDRVCVPDNKELKEEISNACPPTSVGSPEGVWPDTMRNSMETVVRNFAQAQNRAPNLQQREEPVFEEDDEEDVVDDNNSFARMPASQRAILPPRRVDNYRWESGFKLDLPEFCGWLQPEELLDWLYDVEEVLDFKQVLDKMRVSLVATRFKNRASAWWQNLKIQRAREGKNKIASWEKMKKHLRKDFLPYNYSRTMYTKFQNLRQGNKSVDDYASEFFSLMARNSLTETEDQLVSRFIGLRIQLQHTLLQFNPTTVSEAHQRALLIEQQIRSSSASWAASSNRSRSSAPLESINTPMPIESSLPPRDSFGSGSSSHPLRGQPLRCFGCGEQGHRQTAYPQQSRRVLYNDEEPLYDDNGEQEQTLTDDQLVGDIADAAAKLALFTEPHPTPYKLAWLNSKTELRISRRCQVPVSIGVNYKDLVRCDAIPMDAYHRFQSISCHLWDKSSQSH